MHDLVAPLHGRRFYTFGPFRLDPANRLLLRDGQALPLTAKVFDVLLYFAENNGRLLKKEEILQSVWPESFVEEGNLARHVSTLRKILGEGPKDRTYIVTVSGRGYRFVAPVCTATDGGFAKPEHLQRLEAAPPELSTAGDPARESRWRPTRGVLGFTIAALGIAVAALVTAQWIRARSPAANPRDSLSLEWGTNTGDVYGPTISRDGTYLAYIWLTPAQHQGVRVREVGGNTIDVIPPGPVQYWGLRFSPRGDFLYYLIAERASNAIGTLYRVPTLGGRPERILENVNAHIAPSPDGQSVAILRYNAAPGSAAIMTVGSAGGAARTLMTLERPVVVQALDWAPDGRSLLCALKRPTPDGDRWHVVEIPAGGGSPSMILPPRPTKIISAAWLPERQGFLMTAIDRESGLSQIWRIGYPNGVERRLTNDLHEYKDLTVTADGRTLLVQSLRHLTQLWITAAADGNQAKQIASGTAQGAYDALAWTADSQLLYNWSDRGFHEMWRMGADGREQHQLTVDAREIADTSVAPNGRFVFFVSTRSGSRQIWRMGPDGEGLRQLTHMKALVSSPIASANGQWVYFTADERGFLTLWKMTIDGGSVAEVSDQAIELIDLSPDGKRLAYSYRDSDRKSLRVAVVALDGTAPARYFDIEPTFALRWTPDGRELAFTHEQGNIWIQPVDGGSPYALTQVHPSFKVVTFAWSPAGRYLAYTLMEDSVDAIAFKLK